MSGTGRSSVLSRADVATDSPSRYAKQLLSHLGRKVEFTTNGVTSTASIAGGTGTIMIGVGILTLLAQGPDDETVERIEHVLGTHLGRFGARNELVVSWQRAPEPAP